MSWSRSRIFGVSSLIGAAAGGLVYNDNGRSNTLKAPFVHQYIPPPPSRSQVVEKFKRGQEYDMVVIGAGATGSGVALDAATRGLKVALLERDDFGCETSSKSTKLVHGGVRYLEKAFWHLDYDQYKLVKEALHERKIFLDIAPHLSFALPIMIPLFKWWQMPYYWCGVKAYDFLAGQMNLESSYIMTKSQTMTQFPMLNGENLKGSVVYYDGSHNDSRMNVSVALTAQEQGADVLNHCEVSSLGKNGDGMINGISATDLETGEKIQLNTKCVVNATGPFSDRIRKMDDPDCKEIVCPSAGTHIVLPGWFSPSDMGLLDPQTSDGRVLFFLPWQGSTIAGTTDNPCEVENNPVPQEEQIKFILRDISKYIKGKVDVRREDVLAAWTGIRPLVMDPEKMSSGGSQNVVRNHLVTSSKSGLVTIAGGKWTTYRQMAEETVDECVEKFGLEQKNGSLTDQTLLVGAKDWTPLRYIELIQRYNMEPQVARHLSDNYGTRAFTVADMCTLESGNGTIEAPYSTSTHGKKILTPYPFVDGEINYAIKYEYACTAVDFIARRTRLAFLNSKAAYEALPRVVGAMGDELNWSQKRRDKELQDGVEFLKAMGLQFDSSGEVVVHSKTVSPQDNSAPASQHD